MGKTLTTLHSIGFPEDVPAYMTISPIENFSLIAYFLSISLVVAERSVAHRPAPLPCADRNGVGLKSCDAYVKRHSARTTEVKNKKSLRVLFFNRHHYAEIFPDQKEKYP
jgi:hypothetical protein